MRCNNYEILMLKIKSCFIQFINFFRLSSDFNYYLRLEHLNFDYSNLPFRPYSHSFALFVLQFNLSTHFYPPRIHSRCYDAAHSPIYLTYRFLGQYCDLLHFFYLFIYF